ncbi:MAG: hypothetical protein ACI4XL_04375 [Bacillus sp. (in: firmicutes)]
MAGRKGKKCRALFFSLLIILSVLGGCDTVSNKAKEEAKSEGGYRQVKAEPLPFAEEAEFGHVYGWMDNETVLYTDYADGLNRLLSYHLSTKRQEVLYETDQIISEASISPNQQYILVLSSEDHLKLNVQFLTMDGVELYTLSFPSKEYNFEWNQFAEGVISLETFQEDWTFRTFIINIEDQQLEEVTVPEPFAQWGGKKSLLYLDWGEERSDSTAELKELELETGSISNVDSEILSFQALKGALVLVKETADGKGNAKLIYSVLDGDGNLIGEFEAERTHSDETVPPYVFLPERNELFALVPEGSGYDGGMDMVSYDCRTGTRSLIMENLEDAPFMCRPDGMGCLYGYKGEKLFISEQK